MPGAPKTARMLLRFPGERALLEEEPFGPPQQTITHPPSTYYPCRRDRAGRHGRDGCLAPQAMADPSPAHAAAQSAAVTDTASYAGLPWPILLAAVQQATGQSRGSAQAVSYTVRSGDSLSSIAGRFYHKQSAWPVLYWANHSKVHWANILSVGQVLRIPAEPAKIPRAPGPLGRPPRRRPPRPRRSPGRPGVRTRAGRSLAASSYSGGSPGGSFGQCVIARESGGNSQVMNSTGHYGLYQFSQGTWVAYGGSAATSATPARASRTRCSPTRWRRAGSPTGPLTTAADPHQHTTARGERKSPRQWSVCKSGLPCSGDCARARA